MPDQSGKLTELEKQTIRGWLESHWPQPTHCPFCGMTSWVIADHLVQPITLGQNQDLLIGTGVGYPQVMVISAHCGYTVFLNAVMLRIAPAQEITEKK
jgi:hypothetical protein